MNRIKALCISISFLLIVFGFSFINFINPPNEKSAAENRTLAQKPNWDIKETKEFTGLYEEYYTDQFFMRDKFLKFHIRSEIITGKTEIKGFYLKDDFWIVENSKIALKKEQAKGFSDKINKYGDMLNKNGKKVYYVSFPQKENVLESLFPSYSKMEHWQKSRDMFLEGINKDINVINMSGYFNNNFTQEEMKEFYFKTDNHWNGKGAYQGFKEIVGDISSDIDANVKIKDEDYKTSYLNDKKFKGIYNSHLYNIYDINEKIPYVYNKEESKTKYYLNNGGKFEEVDSREIVANIQDKKEIDYGTAYTQSSIYYKTINKEAPIDKKVLIYKDSYYCAMSWLFSDIFREVEVVDPRYIKKFNKENYNIAETTDADLVLFMFNDLSFLGMIAEL